MFEFKDDEIYPVEQSMHGNNMHYHACEFIERRTSYAVCLRTIDAHHAGRADNAIDGACKRAIDNGLCPALAMRKQEQEAGKALFYMDRDKYLSQHSEWLTNEPWSLEFARAEREKRVSARNAALSVANRKVDHKPVEFPVKQQPKIAKPASASSELGDDYAAAINAALKETATETRTPTPAAQPALPGAKPGMSLIELARIRMAQQGA